MIQWKRSGSGFASSRHEPYFPDRPITPPAGSSADSCNLGEPCEPSSPPPTGPYFFLSSEGVVADEDAMRSSVTGSDEVKATNGRPFLLRVQMGRVYARYFDSFEDDTTSPRNEPPQFCEPVALSSQVTQPAASDSLAISSSQAPCAICLKDYDRLVDNRITLRCSHAFCCGCLKRCAQFDHDKCPICRLPHNLDNEELKARLSNWRSDYGDWRRGAACGAAGDITAAITSVSGARRHMPLVAEHETLAQRQRPVEAPLEKVRSFDNTATPVNVGKLVTGDESACSGIGLPRIVM